MFRWMLDFLGPVRGPDFLGPVRGPDVAPDEAFSQ